MKKNFSDVCVSGAIGLIVCVSISLASVSFAEAKKAAPVDKTGLDVLCKADGGVYFPPSKSGISVCAFKDGQVLVCDSKKDKCSASIKKADSKDDEKVTIAEGAMTLRMLKTLDDKVNTLTAQIQFLTETLKAQEREGRKEPFSSP